MKLSLWCFISHNSKTDKIEYARIFDLWFNIYLFYSIWYKILISCFHNSPSIKYLYSILNVFPFVILQRLTYYIGCFLSQLGCYIISFLILNLILNRKIFVCPSKSLKYIIEYSTFTILCVSGRNIFDPQPKPRPSKKR